jgi:signal peptidase II
MLTATKRLGLSPKARWFLAVLTVCLGLDQATKIWTQRAFTGPRDEYVLIPKLLSFVHAENPGAAFSTLADSPYRFYVFGTFTIIAVGALLHMYRQLEPGERFRAAAVGFILSGALGNGLDRLYKQTVTDFVKVFWGFEGSFREWLYDNVGTNVWPVWNVADATIVVGIALFFLEPLFFKEKAKADADPGESPLGREDSADKAAAGA